MVDQMKEVLMINVVGSSVKGEQNDEEKSCPFSKEGQYVRGSGLEKKDVEKIYWVEKDE